MNKVKICEHRFEPRYTEIYSTDLNDSIPLGDTQITYHISRNCQHSYLKEKRYIHDICIKCGMIKKG